MSKIMKIRSLTKREAEKEYLKWRDDPAILPEIPTEYRELRKELEDICSQAKEESKPFIRNQPKRSMYFKDIWFGLKLYEYLNSQDWFTLSVASNDGFWRYLGTCVIPNVIDERWGPQVDHYYGNIVRIYPRAMWWYVWLSWQGDIESTKETMFSPNMNTDIVLNVVERPGRNGVNVDVVRQILKFYGMLNLGSAAESLFRPLMKLNLSKSLVVDPVLYEGGVRGYVLSLYEELGVTRGKAPDIYREE